MQHTLRPFLTGSFAVATAALVSVAPVTPQLPAVQHQAVALTSAATASSAAGDVINLGFLVIGDGSIGLFPLGPTADLLGLGNVTLAQIVDFLGLGDDQLNTLLPGLVDGLSLGTTTLGTLVDGLGLANGLVNGLGLDGVTLGSLVDGLGLGSANVGDLAGGLVNGLGLGDTTLNDLLGGLGLGSMDLGALAPILTGLGEAIPGLNSVTFGDVVDGLGLSNVQTGTLLSDLGANPASLAGFLELIGLVPGLNGITTIGGLVNLVGLTDAAVFPGLVTLLTDPAAGLSDISLSSALDVMHLGDATLNQVLGALPLTMTTDELLGGLGLDDATLGELLGTGLIPAGATVGGLLDAIGLSDTSLDSLITGLNNSGLALLNDTVDQLLTSIGIDDATIDDLLNGLGLYDHALFSFDF